MSQQKVVVIDNDSGITHLIRDFLKEENFSVFIASNGIQALQMIEENQPNIVVLDIMIPDIDGFEVLQRLRQWSQVPVIALSARRDISDKTRCLNFGADDYMTKPFSLEELLARMNAVLRRIRGTGIAQEISEFTSGDLSIDFEKRLVTLSGSEIKLTPIEYSILRELTLNIGKALTHKQLIHDIWGYDYESEKQTLFVHVSKLRAKIEKDPKHPVHIITLPRIGYKFHQ